MLTTNIKLSEKYDYKDEKFKKAYEFLEFTDFSHLSSGRVEIDGDQVFAEVQEYTTMNDTECQFESHRKYFDIQYVAEGEEYLGYIKTSELTVDMEYDKERDLIFYHEPEVSGRVHLQKGDFAVVSPEDGHKPRCIGKSPCKVKKIVVKVSVL